MQRVMSFAILLFLLYGCVSTPTGINDVSVYTSAPPYSGEPKVAFGSPAGALPLFKFTYFKEDLHYGLPTPSELQIVKMKGAALGGKLLVLDCPRPGVIGAGICIVYGYEK